MNAGRASLLHDPYRHSWDWRPKINATRHLIMIPAAQRMLAASWQQLMIYGVKVKSCVVFPPAIVTGDGDGVWVAKTMVEVSAEPWTV